MINSLFNGNFDLNILLFNKNLGLFFLLISTLISIIYGMFFIENYSNKNLSLNNFNDLINFLYLFKFIKYYNILIILIKNLFKY